MPKKIRFEAFKYRFMTEAEDLSMVEGDNASVVWPVFLDGLAFEYDGPDVIITHSEVPCLNERVALKDAVLYRRGDNDIAIEKQRTAGLLFSNDDVQDQNQAYFQEIVRRVGKIAGYVQVAGTDGRINAERDFHDAWAASENLGKIDARQANEACTAPEMRNIIKSLGDLTGKKVLDIGCGLGEVSVYFAMCGAKVTASDLSPGMCAAAEKMAVLNDVEIETHVASSESLGLPDDVKFDVIFAGNMLHHVDIATTMAQILPHLAPEGRFVSWDPVAYNPVINVYRRMAMQVRTEDEHPLTRADVAHISSYFKETETQFYWFTALIIFVIMAVVQRRNPNKERYWKSVVQEAPKWAWLYVPLERVDRRLLAVFPSLRWLCWNVVIIARNPINKTS